MSTKVDVAVRVQVIDIALRGHNDRRTECIEEGNLDLAAFWTNQITKLLDERFQLTDGQAS